MYQPYPVDAIAGKPAPTLGSLCIRQRWVAMLLLLPLRSATRPPCSAFDLDLLLILILICF
ncbi:hypothetical protein C7U57_20200 [Pseudomonas sp. R9.37]|nr:hypothetical protein C7U57_20200 [Pseudomonas sp. R9.37]